MRMILILKTADGSRVRITLNNRGAGRDDILREWTFENPYWRCIDSGQLAEQAGPAVTEG